MMTDLTDEEERFLEALVEQLVVQMEDVARSQVVAILRDALPDGVRLYDDDIDEAAAAADVDDPETVMAGLEEKEIIDRWTDVSTMTPKNVEGGLDEEKRIEKRMLSVDEAVLDRLIEAVDDG